MADDARSRSAGLGLRGHREAGASSSSTSARNIRRRMACCAWCWSWTASWSSASIRTSACLHRGTEKLMEARPYPRTSRYFDRLDYVAPMNQEHAFCWPSRSCSAGDPAPRPADPGALFRDRPHPQPPAQRHHPGDGRGRLTPPFWGFEEREKLMVFYERACGRAGCTPTTSAPAACARTCRPRWSTTSRPGAGPSRGCSTTSRA